MLYERYAAQKPVMLFDIQEERVYAFPFAGFRAELSERSRRSLAQQYQRALAKAGWSSSSETASGSSSFRTASSCHTRPDPPLQPRAGACGGASRG
jgi:hypothetical protein